MIFELTVNIGVGVGSARDEMKVIPKIQEAIKLTRPRIHGDDVKHAKGWFTLWTMKLDQGSVR